MKLQIMKKRLQQKYINFGNLVSFIGIIFSLYVILFAVSLFTSRLRYSIIFLGLGLVLFYMNELSNLLSESNQFNAKSSASTQRQSLIKKRQDSKENALSIYFLAIVILLLLTISYIWIEYERLISQGRIVGISNLDAIVGFVITFIIIDATTRAYGIAIGGVVIASIGYAMLGPYLPSVLYHTGQSPIQISRLAVMELRGVFGFILGVGSTWVAIFIIFAGIARSFDLLDWLSSLGDEVSKVTKTGVVHLTLLSSIIVGSITGSAAANAATTGSFTIPMMKNQEISSDYAAAFESVASSGGQILPPVMGVAAFLMADILGVPYVQIIQAGLLPALIFYVGVGLSIHIVVYKYNWTIVKSDKKLITGKFQELLRYLLPLFVLMYTLVVLRFTPLAAGFYTIVAFVANVMIYDMIVSETNFKNLASDWIKNLISGLSKGAVDLAPLVPVLAALGIILDVIQRTGLTQRLSFQMITLAGGSLIILLILAMLTSIIFGMGMPTPAAYILVVILTAPALTSFGISPITAHMFVFYAAIISAITPPVAIAVAVTSRIAESNFIKSSIYSVQIGLILFIIPFGFVYNESLIYWTFPETFVHLLFFLLGTLSLSIGLHQHNTLHQISYKLSFAHILISFALIFGNGLVRLISVVLLSTLLVYQYTRNLNR